MDHGVDVDRLHGADVGAVAAGDTFIGIDSHGASQAFSPNCNRGENACLLIDFYKILAATSK
jgi:hypothetical protein